MHTFLLQGGIAMIIVKNNNHKRIIISIICLFFALGAAAGILIAMKYNPDAASYYPETFEKSFITLGKYIFLLWLVGFSSIGIFCVPPVCGLCGFSYGTACAVLLMQNNKLGFLASALKYVLFLIAMFLTASSSSQLSLNCYKIHRNPKSNLPREREREITEHVIILLISAVPISFAALIDVHLVGIFL